MRWWWLWWWNLKLMRHSYCDCVIVSVSDFVVLKKENTNTDVLCVWMLSPGKEHVNRPLYKITLEWGGWNTLRLVPGFITFHTQPHHATTPSLSSPQNSFICSSLLQQPFITSHHSLWLEETVMENQIRSQEDIRLHSFFSPPSLSHWNPSWLWPDPRKPPMWQDWRGLIGTLGELLKDIVIVIW